MLCIFFFQNIHCKGGSKVLLKWHLGVFTQTLYCWLRGDKCIKTAITTVYFDIMGWGG